MPPCWPPSQSGRRVNATSLPCHESEADLGTLSHRCKFVFGNHYTIPAFTVIVLEPQLRTITLMDRTSSPGSGPMEPPEIPPQTRRYRKEEWEVHRGLIVGLYPMQGMKL